MSGLTKKTVIADRTLSTLLGVNEGELVSYAELSKGLHKYIRDNDLKNPQLRQTPAASSPSPPPSEPVAAQPLQPTPGATVSMRKCRDCAGVIPADAVFCDLCGVEQ